jgi:hypothetical protein
MPDVGFPMSELKSAKINQYNRNPNLNIRNDYMPLFTSRKQEKKVKVTFANGLLFVEKPDGKRQAFPLEWFPKLLNATDEERKDWKQADKGIHFNKLGVDVLF